MNKIIRFVCFGLVVFYSSVITTKVYAQKPLNNETIERIVSYWSSTFEEMRVEQGVSRQEFDTYNRFFEHQIDSIQTEFMKGMWAGTVTVSNVKDYMAKKKVIFEGMLNNFQAVEKEFPSSVDEYRYKKRPRLSADSCFPACYNTGFEDGTFDGWYGFYAVNNSTRTTFNISAPIGGYLGAVTVGAADPNTGTNQLRITSGVVTDPFLNAYSTYSMPEVSPYGGNHSVLLGDSSKNGQGVAILSQSFLVTSATASITYQYALFLENPSNASHTYYEQPFFTVNVIDNVTGDTIPGCGSYHQDALIGSSSPGFKGVYYPTEADSVYWKNWTLANVPLKNYVGHCVTIVFEVQDCSLGGHFGYAYVDASCNPEQVIASSPALCGQDSLSLTAPPGYTNYLWSGNPTTGIISNDTLQTVYVNAGGTYTVVVKNLTGGICTDTLVIHVDSLGGTIPRPSFTADTVCAGQPTTFINTSSPISGQFFWDFYNLGNYEDSNITNPTWSYSTPGTYTVKLYELDSGCGAYFYKNIIVYPSVAGAFTYAGAGCAPETVTFTNGTVGATTYYWNYGDPSSAPNDTSTAASGSHTYTNPGTYTVTMIASNGGPCPDTIRQVINVQGPPKPIITGSDSVCTGGTDTISVTVIGGATYVWAPGGQTSSSIAVTISGPTTYTVTATNGCGTHDTTFTVNIGGLPIALLTVDKDTICSGDTVLLMGGGGGTYKWNTGATTSNIKVVPLITTSYTVHVSQGTTTCSDSAEVTIFVNPKITSALALSGDSICPGSAATLTVSSSGGPPNYIWSNGATTSSITVNPANTTTYYVLVGGTCANDSIAQTVTVVPYPTITITSSDTVCKGSTATVTASGANTYLWNNGSTNNPITVTVNNDTTLIVTGTNGHCTNHNGKTIDIYNPLVSRSGNDTVCRGGAVSVGVQVSGGNHVYTYSWNNGVTYDSAGPLTVVAPPTQYICTVTDGCGSVVKDTININLYPTPHDTFAPTPDTILGGGFVNFVNYTTNATNYYWNLGDGNYSSDTTPFHEYFQAGTYLVTLIATNTYGCRDTISRDVYVIEKLVVPNVFTPNGDGQNDVFHIEAGSMQTYDIQIFNRWGQLIFETNSPNIDWTGRSSSGELEADGTYYYVIKATDYDGKSFSLDGFVQLIR